MFARVRSLLFVGILGLLALLPTMTRAQTAPVLLPGIEATGFGVAVEPASTARLQFMIGAEGAMMMDPSTLPDLTVGDLAPIVTLLETSGAEVGSILIELPDRNSMYGPGGPVTAEIRASVANPTADQLKTLIDAVDVAASTAGLALTYAGVLYDVADCNGLTQRARDAAIADAQNRATALADSLDLQLGELIRASESPYFGGYQEVGSCLPAGTESMGGPFGPGSLPPFDSTKVEASVSMQVTLTYAIGASA